MGALGILAGIAFVGLLGRALSRGSSKFISTESDFKKEKSFTGQSEQSNQPQPQPVPTQPVESAPTTPLLLPTLNVPKPSTPPGNGSPDKTSSEKIIHAGKEVPNEIVDAVDLIAANKATASGLETVASLAEATGFPEQADALRKAASKIPASVKKLKSPLPTVDDLKWGQFASKMKQGQLGTVTPAAHMGLFLISFKRLKDLGLVKNVRKVVFNTPTSSKGNTAYVGDFIPPLTREKFLSDAAIQYATFEKNIKDYYGKILSDFAKEVGKEHEGKPATLSGLLAVAVAAGISGMKEWIKGNKMPYTSKFYQRVNGIF